MVGDRSVEATALVEVYRSIEAQLDSDNVRAVPRPI